MNACESQEKMKQFVVTPVMSKRLIGRAMACETRMRAVLERGTLVIIAGTTNGYVAEEILRNIGQDRGFSRKGFRRGTVTPPNFNAPAQGELEGDVVITDGVWAKGKTIFDVVDDLPCGDVILKGANALDLVRGRAGVYIAHPQGGTIIAALQAIVGRRVRLIVPVTLEKRICGDISEIATQCNAPHTEGPRMLPLPGEVFTELDALATLTGARAILLAGGGIYGAQGCVHLGVKGDETQLNAAEALMNSLADEPPCEV